MLERFIRLANESGKVSDLRVPGGEDAYSTLDYGTLADKVGAEAIREVAAAWEDASDRQLAACYRWVLRGLRPDLAVKKVKLGEVIGRSKRRRSRDHFNDDPRAAERGEL